MNGEAKKYFLFPSDRKQILYEALRTSFVNETPDKKVCEIYELNFNTFRSLKKEFRNTIKNNENPISLFFKDSSLGKREKNQPELIQKIISLRVKCLSLPEIKAILSSEGITVSLWKIDKILKNHNFPPLQRRTQQLKLQINIPNEFKAPESYPLEFPLSEKFESLNGSIFLFYPLLKKINIETLIADSGYPETSQISRLNAILSFTALKLLNTKRLSHSNEYNLDRGLGFFAGLNMLPKNSWFGSYSYNVNRSMNIKFMQSLNRQLENICPSSGDFNLDFTTIPHWGDKSVLERNWSGTRHVGLKSVLALLVQDQESKLLKYGDAEIKHSTQSNAILEFVDFYKEGGGDIKCLIFDSKFTTYKNLSQLNMDNIKFLTLRRRSNKLLEHVAQIEESNWKKVKLNKNFRRKHRNLLVYESPISLKDYEGSLRQIVITNNGRKEPAFIITNDFDITMKNAVLKYAKRWLVEQAIAEQTDFYHLNRLCSSIVVKVDFDLTMSILADTLYKLFCLDIPGFEDCKSEKIYREIIKNYARFDVSNKEKNKICITLNKKVHLPALYETDWFADETTIPWLEGYKLKFKIGTTL